MKLTEMLDILDRNNVRGILVHSKRDFVRKVIYLESTCRIRTWVFDGHGHIVDTKFVSAPNGEMDLLNVYANEIANCGIDYVAWC